MRDRIRQFNKHILNHLTRRFASLSGGPFALVRHVGRHSGKQYETPIMTWQLPDGFLIVLTYGPEVDWLRNISAAGHCALVWHGKEYALGKPEPLPETSALPVLPRLIRMILSMLGTHEYVKLRYQTAPGGSAA